MNRERSQAARDAILALGSSIPQPEFVDLDAGFEYFGKHGVALPQETVEYGPSKRALVGSVLTRPRLAPFNTIVTVHSLGPLGTCRYSIAPQ